MMTEINKIEIIIKRNSFWIKNFEMPSKKDYRTCTSYSLYKSICNQYNLYANKYQCTLDLYDEKEKILKLPFGYGLHNIILNLENSSNINKFKTIDESDLYNDYNLLPNRIDIKPEFSPRNKIQSDAIEWISDCYTRKEKTHHSVYLSLLTGGGKTFVAIYTMVKLRLPCLIISYNLSDQWKEKILEYTTARESDIYMIKGSDSLLRLLNTKHRTYSFYIVSVSTFRSFSKKYNVLDSLFYKMRVGVKIFDEAHTQYKMNAFIDTNSNTRYTLYLSATPGRSNSTENKVYQNFFKMIPMHGTYTHKLDNHYKVKYISYNTKPNQQQRRFCSTTKGFNANNYYKYIMADNEKRYAMAAMIVYLADKILVKHPNHRVLCFIPSLEYMDFLTKFITKLKPPYSVGQYNSNISNAKKRELELNKNLIITTIAACSTGKDIPNLKAIISATPFSSQIICKQILGRLRPLADGGDSYFFDFTDIGFAGQMSQRNSRSKILNVHAATTENLELKLDEMLYYISNDTNSKGY